MMMPNDSISGRGDLSILFIAEHSIWGLLGYQSALAFSSRVAPIFWCAGDPTPPLLESWRGDWILSFKSDLILKGDSLARASRGAVNFHPGPPKYRGVGGYYWALRNRDAEYGVTSHFMVDRIDFGPIVDFQPFRLSPAETVSSLRFRTAVFLLAQLNSLLVKIASNETLVTTDIQWSPHLYTYSELRNAQE
jgi:methionyl-tRNA formyltransferase